MGAYLSSPKIDKESYDGGDLTVDPSRYGLSCMQGWRKNMEDSHICYNNLKIQEIGESISIYGVFDGHGGPNVSRWISYHFLPIFLKCLNAASEHLAKMKIDKNGEYYKLQLIKLSLEETFLKLDEEMRSRENQEKLKKYSVPQQKGEEDTENRDNYIYSILNDIVSKNISIKTIEKDGRRCLQVVYNKDENSLEEEEECNIGESEQRMVVETGDELVNMNNASLVTNPKGVADGLKLGKEGGVKNVDLKEEEWTLKKDDAALGGIKEDAITGTESGKNITKDGEGGCDTLRKEQQKDSGKTGDNAERNALGENVNNAAEKKEEENKEDTEDNKTTEMNKATIAKRLKKDVNAEKEIKKEESCYISGNENKGNDTSGIEETRKYVETNQGTEETTTASSEKSEAIKSDLTYENLKYKDEQDERKLDLTISDVSNIPVQVSEENNIDKNLNGNILTHPENEGFFEDTNDNGKQISIDDVLDSEDFRPFLEEFEEADEDITDHVEDHDGAENIAYSCGSTAIVAVILKGYLLVANAGDSRAIVCFNGNSLGMSTDHKPHLEEEEMRIKKAGGYISNGRVDGNLNLTRAIGDLHYKSDPFLSQKDQKISAFPDIKCVTLTPEDEFLFLACDGIWDCKEGEEIVSFVKSRLNKFVEKKEGGDGRGVEVNEADTNKKKDLKDPSEFSQIENQAYANDQKEVTKIEDQKIDNNSNETQNETLITNLEQKNIEEKPGSVTSINKYERIDKLSQICEELCDTCLSTNCRDTDGIGCDNMTCLIVQYNPIYKSQTEKKFLDLDEILAADKST